MIEVELDQSGGDGCTTIDGKLLLRRYLLAQAGALIMLPVLPEIPVVPLGCE